MTKATITCRVIALCLAGLCSMVSGALGQAGAAVPEYDEVTVQEQLKQVEQEYGIRVDFIQLSSAGYMLDMRYWVTDVDKAWSLFKDTQKRELFHPASGAKMIVPAPAYVGPMAQTKERPRRDRRYFLFFANPGKTVKSGELVTVTIGDAVIGPLKVR